MTAPPPLQAWTDKWFHTGDIGRINADGTISIIDRKKNIFKLSFGECKDNCLLFFFFFFRVFRWIIIIIIICPFADVAPENLENIFCRSPLVAQAFIYGDSLQSFLVAVIVPEEETVMKWAQDNKISGASSDIFV